MVSQRIIVSALDDDGDRTELRLRRTYTPVSLTPTIWKRGLAMISYWQAARELDARWTGSLQFLPPTPKLRNEQDCIVARQIATTEIDLFNRYAKEIATVNGLKLGLLVDLYDMMLSTGLMFADERDDTRTVRCLPPAPKHPPSSPASKPSRSKPKLHRTHHDRE